MERGGPRPLWGSAPCAFRSTSLRQATCHGVGVIITIMAMLPPMRDRIHLARRAAHLGRLTDRGLSPEGAERAVAAWEEEAESRGLDREAPDYWTQGEALMAERRWT